MVTPTRRGILRGSAAISGGLLTPSIVSAASEGSDDDVAAQDLLVYRAYMNVPGYDYLGSVRRDDFCYWSTSACIQLAVLSAFAASPLAAKAIGASCVVQAAGCQLYDDLERLTPYEFEWIHVYMIEGWLQPGAGLPPFVAVAEPVRGLSDDQEMLAEAVAGLKTDDEKIGTGELATAIDAWSSGDTVPGTDYTVSTDNLLILIEFWSKGRPVS